MLFYGEELLAPRPTSRLDVHPLSAVRDCLFNILAATLHIGGRSSNSNLRARHAVVTGTLSSRITSFNIHIIHKTNHKIYLVLYFVTYVI